MATFETRKNKEGKKRFRAAIRRTGAPAKRGTFPTQKKADTWAAIEEAKILDGRYGLSAAADHHTAGEMIERYIVKHLPLKSTKKRYLAQQKMQLLWWKARIGAYALSAVTRPLLNECRDELREGRKNETVNRYLSALSHVFTVAVTEWEWLASSPLIGVPRLKEGKGRDRYLLDHERPGIIDAARLERRKPLLLIVVLGIASGARKNELLSLELKNVNPETGAATQEETKNYASKTFFVTGWALELLRAYLAGQRHPRSKYLFPSRFGNKPMNIEREWTRIRRRAGIEDFRFHDLRHTFGSYLSMNGATPQEVAAALNQKTLQMAMRYSHLARTHVEQKVAGMNEKLFGSQKKQTGESHDTHTG